MIVNEPSVLCTFHDCLHYVMDPSNAVKRGLARFKPRSHQALLTIHFKPHRHQALPTIYLAAAQIPPGPAFQTDRAGCS